MNFKQLPDEFYPTPPELAAKMVNCKFLKGTMHIKFRDLDLLKRFNIYGCQHKGWLPPSYGKKSYSEMNAEEKQVVDEYEGQQEYEKVYNNRENYILDVGQRMLLTDGG